MEGTSISEMSTALGVGARVHVGALAIRPATDLPRDGGSVAPWIRAGRGMRADRASSHSFTSSMNRSLRETATIEAGVEGSVSPSLSFSPNSILRKVQS
jgi:hypothetical protein